MTTPAASSESIKRRAKPVAAEAAPMTLLQITTAMAQLDALIAEHDGEMTPDVEAQFDTLGLSFADKVDAYMAKRQAFLRTAAACEAEAKRLTARARRCSTLAEALESRLLDRMKERDLKEHDGERFRVVRTANPYVVKAIVVDAPVMRGDITGLPEPLQACVAVTPATAESYAWDKAALIALYKERVATRDEALKAEDAAAVAAAELALAEVKQIALIERGERLTVS